MKRHIYLFCLLFSAHACLAQQYYIKGQVKDERGNALQNVGIRIQSTGYLYYSGFEGSFGIPVSKADTLHFFYDGYQKQRVPISTESVLDIRLAKAAATKGSRFYKLASFTQNLKREMQQQWFIGDETYASLVENGFLSARTHNTTGLTLNVDRASYSNIRRFLTTNTPVPPDAVRMEELLNYFNFGYKEPEGQKIFDITTTLSECPWNKSNQLLIAQVRSKKLNLDSLPSSHLVFLIDVSGSMDMPNRLPLLKSGFKTLVNNLRVQDSVSIIVYGGTVGIALQPTGGGDKEIILKTIDSLQASGTTPGESGIKLAYSVARSHFITGGNNRIILATDGDFNVGLRTEDELEEMISAQRERGIYLTCLGIGMGNYKDSKIQTLAQRGNGNFAYLDSYAEAEKVLMKEFTQTLYTVADDAYLNVWFNPAYVKDYRLIGFDNKAGAIKDTSAIIEGGEIGSAYSALVAFEITPVTPALPGTSYDSLVRYALNYRQPGKENLVKMAFAPTVVLSDPARLPKYHGFAGAVLMFGSLLRQSKYLGESNWNTLLQLATTYADHTSYTQTEFVSLVQQAKAMYGKKSKREREGK